MKPHFSPRRALAAVVLGSIVVSLVSCSSSSNGKSGKSSGNPIDAITQIFTKGTGNATVDKATQEAVVRKLGETAGAGQPLVLDQSSAYPTITEPVADFHPKSFDKLTEKDLFDPLPPGDYSIAGVSYCTQWSMHYPGRGVPYKIARIHGKQSAPIGALLTRGTAMGIAPGRLNCDAWRIQGGVPLSKWPPSEQKLADQLVYEYEQQLEGDYLDHMHKTYDSARALDGGLPTYNAMLVQMGAPGQTILQLQKARAVLANQTMAAETMPDHLYEPTGDGLPRTLPADPHAPPSPWCQLGPGVIARFTCIQGNCGRNTLDLRVTRVTNTKHASRRDVQPAPPAMFAAFADPNAADGGYADEPEPEPPSLAQIIFTDLGNWLDAPRREREAAAERAEEERWKRQIQGPGGGWGEWQTIITYSQGKPAQALIFVPYMDLRYGSIGIRG